MKAGAEGARSVIIYGCRFFFLSFWQRSKCGTGTARPATVVLALPCQPVSRCSAAVWSGRSCTRFPVPVQAVAAGLGSLPGHLWPATLWYGFTCRSSCPFPISLHLYTELVFGIVLQSCVVFRYTTPCMHVHPTALLHRC